MTVYLIKAYQIKFQFLIKLEKNLTIWRVFSSIFNLWFTSESFVQRNIVILSKNNLWYGPLLYLPRRIPYPLAATRVMKFYKFILRN